MPASVCRATFWGTGTSTGIPVVGCRCAVCTSTDPRNRRRRASLLVEWPGSEASVRVLIDAGPDFRLQALDAGLEALDAVVLTHAHADHILGLDDLRPLSWARPIVVAGSRSTLASVRRVFPYFWGPPGPSSRPHLEFQTLRSGQRVEVAGCPLRPLPIWHGPQTIFGYRIGDLAYLTDCSGLTPAARRGLRGVDTLIVDALRLKPHPTHLHRDAALALAREVGARQTWLTHFSHDVDHEAWSRDLPPEVQPAWDGLTIEFPAGALG